MQINIIKFMAVACFVLAVTGCDSNEPSAIGKLVEQRLTHGKNDFEDKDFKEMLQEVKINENFKEHLVSAAEGLQSVSKKLDPSWAREGIERSELTLACLVAKTTSEQELEALKNEIGGVINDPKARADLFKRMNELKAQLYSTAFLREACN